MQERIERLILRHLATGQKTFDELLTHIRDVTEQGRSMHRHFEDAMMNLQANNRIVEVQFRLFRLSTRRVL